MQENAEKVKMNKQLPYLVANVVELLDVEPEVVLSSNITSLNSYPLT